MEDTLITIETAKLAKEKGFDWDCLYAYAEDGHETLQSAYDFTGEDKFTVEDLNNAKDNGEESYFAPTQSLMQKYLREKHMIRVYLKHGVQGNFNFEIYIWDKPNNIGKWTRIGNIVSSDTYEQALEEGLRKALKLIKQ